MSTYSDHEQRQLDQKPVPKQSGMWKIECACECVGNYGANPDCCSCGGDGSVTKYTKTLPDGYPRKDAQFVYGP